MFEIANSNMELVRNCNLQDCAFGACVRAHACVQARAHPHARAHPRAPARTHACSGGHAACAVLSTIDALIPGFPEPGAQRHLLRYGADDAAAGGPRILGFPELGRRDICSSMGQMSRPQGAPSHALLCRFVSGHFSLPGGVSLSSFALPQGPPLFRRGGGLCPPPDRRDRGGARHPLVRKNSPGARADAVYAA